MGADTTRTFPGVGKTLNANHAVVREFVNQAGSFSSKRWTVRVGLASPYGLRPRNAHCPPEAF
jgi:hypothetical protein